MVNVDPLFSEAVEAIKTLKRKLENRTCTADDQSLAVHLVYWYDLQLMREVPVLELSEFKSIAANYRIAFVAWREIGPDIPASIRSIVGHTVAERRKALITALIENNTYLDRNLESLLLSLETSRD